MYISSEKLDKHNLYFNSEHMAKQNPHLPQSIGNLNESSEDFTINDIVWSLFDILKWLFIEFSKGYCKSKRRKNPKTTDWPQKQKVNEKFLNHINKQWSKTTIKMAFPWQLSFEVIDNLKTKGVISFHCLASIGDYSQSNTATAIKKEKTTLQQQNLALWQK